MIRFISAEFLKLRKRPMTKVLLLVLIVMIAGVYLLTLPSLGVTTSSGEEMSTIKSLAGLSESLPFVLFLLFQIFTILAIILVAGSIGDEYGWGTIRTTLICSESRVKFLTVKLITVLLMVLVGMVIGLVVGFIMCLITTAIAGNPFDFSFMTGGYLWDQFLQFWRTFFLIMPYILLAFFFSIVGCSAIAGAGVGIGVFFLEPMFAPLLKSADNWIANIPDYLLAANTGTGPIMALIQLPESFKEEMLSVSSIGVWQAAVVLAGYCILFLLLSFYLFRRRDVTV